MIRLVVLDRAPLGYVSVLTAVPRCAARPWALRWNACRRIRWCMPR